MSQRLQDTTKWLWCVLVVCAGPVWSPVSSVTVRTPPKTPANIEAQAKFFQDFFSVQLSPYKIEFGHVCEDPNNWEQRYEKKDFKNHRDMGKVRWGDKQGGYGEHYWDLNHAGHAGNHGDDKYGSDSDDGSYHVHDNNHDDPYDEPSETSPSYDNEYDPEKNSYEESNRAKRAPLRAKLENKEEYEEEDEPKPKLKKYGRKIKEPQAPRNNEDTEDVEQEESYKKPTKKRQHRPVLKEHDYEEEYQQPKEQSNQYQTRQKENSDNQERQEQPQPSQYARRQQDQTRFVPYEGGAGVRQHQQPEATAAASAPRLFLEPTTGHVVDRATGQAYILQPIPANNNYN